MPRSTEVRLDNHGRSIRVADREAAFRHGGLVNFQIQLGKRVDTRSDMADWERSHADDVSVPDCRTH